mmetsp:Transcript_8261/g.15372  ORF Transcript_8261/g.15372 Transcript_8261/m.15372 type:complete len:305 (+) Transcript_8261:185-1099(+)
MDALKALAGEHGCSVDGTAAQRNPLSSFVNQGMGGPQHQHQGMRHGQQGAHGRGMSDIDRGMSAGMGVMAGPRGPIMAGPGAAPSFAQEFEQMRAGGPPPGPMMNGPRAHGPRGGDQWINDFERMKLGGGMPQRNIQMEAAFRENLRRQQGPRPMGQRWAGQMAARPPPSHMDHAWKQTARPPEPAQQWAQEMAGPTEAPDAEKWAQEASAEPKTEGNDMEATRRATDDLVRVMAENPKFRDSEFFSFMNKVNTGELAFENNTVVETGINVVSPTPRNVFCSNTNFFSICIAQYGPSMEGECPC